MYIFVDFDDTLCLHTHWRPLTEYCWAEPKDAVNKLFGHAQVNKPLYDYLLEKINNGDKVYLLTQSSSLMLKIKMEWIKQKYPLLKFEDFVCMASDENTKANLMELFAQRYQLDHKQLLLIDDKSKERWQAEKKGFLSTNPQLIANEMYEKILKTNSKQGL